MKKAALFLCLTFAYLYSIASGDGEKKLPNEGTEISGKKAISQDPQPSPNFPGSLRIGFGFSFLKDAPADLNLGWWKSRSLDVYYIADMPLGTSGFTFNPGIGVGIDRFGFSRDITLKRTTEGTAISPIADVEVKKSLLSTTFFDIPLELKYNFNKTDPNRGFNIAVGGKVGYLINAHTKVNSEEEGTLIKLKTKEHFNINKLRYGITGRIGIGRFNLFYYQSLVPFFESNKGPMDTEAVHYKVGFSFAAF